MYSSSAQAAEQLEQTMLFRPAAKLSPSTHGDFFWVFVTRAFYYMGISLQAFLLFMMRDVQQVRAARRTCRMSRVRIRPARSPAPRCSLALRAQVEDPKRITSLLAMTNQLSAALIAAPSGWVSDRYGRKPLVYASCVVMATQSPLDEINGTQPPIYGELELVFTYIFTSEVVLKLIGLGRSQTPALRL